MHSVSDLLHRLSLLNRVSFSDIWFSHDVREIKGRARAIHAIVSGEPNTRHQTSSLHAATEIPFQPQMLNTTKSISGFRLLTLLPSTFEPVHNTSPRQATGCFAPRNGRTGSMQKPVAFGFTAFLELKKPSSHLI